MLRRKWPGRSHESLTLCLGVNNIPCVKGCTFSLAPSHGSEENDKMIRSLGGLSMFLKLLYLSVVCHFQPLKSGEERGWDSFQCLSAEDCDAMVTLRHVVEGRVPSPGLTVLL